MAGTDLGFNATEFRDAIRFAMTMGSPTKMSEKATFRWTRQQTFDPQDPAKRPYRWTQAPVTDATPADVTLDNVAVEYATNRAGGGTAVGEFVPLRATLTLLDEEHELVKDADMVILGGSTYQITMTTVVAMFNVDVYQMFCERL